MSNLNYYIIYNPSNYNADKFKNISEFKNHFLHENNKSFLFINSLGNEYNQDTVNQIKFDEDNKRIKYIVYYFNNNESYNFQENTADGILLNQIEIDKILSEYLESKKSNLDKSKEVCYEILKRYDDFKEDKEGINNFVDSYENTFENDKECKNYMDMIKNSPNEIDNLSPKYKEIIENEISPMLIEVMKKIENTMKIEIEGKPNIKNFEEKKTIFEENDKKIKEKLLNIINNQELIYSMEKKMNEILIYGEKLNFFLNLSEIPNVYYEIDKNTLKEEYKRRNKFNYLYEKIMHFVESDLMCQEYEYRKKFIKKNFKFSNKLKMEKKTISILNKLLDFEAQKLFISESELYKSNYDLADSLTRSIDELSEYLSKISEELFSKKKKGININNKNISEESLNKDKNTIIKNNKFSEQFGEIKQILRSSSVPELNQKKIISIIENKIINQNIESKIKIYQNSFNNSSDEIFLSSYDYISGEKDTNKFNQNLNKIITYFSETYGRFLWFYEKAYNYLQIYNQKCNNQNFDLNKNDPYSVNSYLVEILNENKLLKEKINQIRMNTGLK